MAEAAASEVAELLRPLRDGHFNRYYEESLSDSWRSTTTWQAAKELGDRVRPVLGQVETRSLVEARYANRALIGEARFDRPFAFLVHSVGLPGGRMVLETATLELQDDGWKLAGLWYLGV